MMTKAEDTKVKSVVEGILKTLFPRVRKRVTASQNITRRTFEKCVRGEQLLVCFNPCIFFIHTSNRWCCTLGISKSRSHT